MRYPDFHFASTPTIDRTSEVRGPEWEIRTEYGAPEYMRNLTGFPTISRVTHGSSLGMLMVFFGASRKLGPHQSLRAITGKGSDLGSLWTREQSVFQCPLHPHKE